MADRRSPRRQRNRRELDFPVDEFLDAILAPVQPPVHGSSRLEPIPLPDDLDQMEIDPETSDLIALAKSRIQAFQDRWDQPQIEQFVASDFEYVYQAMRWIRQQPWLIGNRMVEWGCGFAVVACLASRLGWDVFGIDAEKVLLDHARQTVDDFQSPVELVHGNFLPRGVDQLEPRENHPSLGHPVPNAYQSMGIDLDDFALVFGYPWPGEEGFHQSVFHQHAAPGALLLQFCGPYDLRLWRKG